MTKERYCKFIEWCKEDISHRHPNTETCNDSNCITKRRVQSRIKRLEKVKYHQDLERKEKEMFSKEDV